MATSDTMIMRTSTIHKVLESLTVSIPSAEFLQVLRRAKAKVCNGSEVYTEKESSDPSLASSSSPEPSVIASPVLPQCQTELTTAAADLLKLSHSTEREFLSLGERLNEISTVNRHNASLAEKVSIELVQSRSADLDLVKELLSTGFKKADCAEKSLHQLSGELGKMAGNIEEIIHLNELLDRTYRSLRMVRVMIRIETENAGHTDFHTVADALVSLEELIAKNAEQIHQASSQTSSLIHQMLARFEEESSGGQHLLKEDQHRILDLISQITDELVSIDDGCQQMSEHTKSISSRIGDVVMNLQFHDNYRQRLEHISHTLTEVNEKIENSITKNSPENDSAKPWLTTVVQLQIAQLENLKMENKQVSQHLSDSFTCIQELMKSQAEIADRVMPIMESLDQHVDELDRLLKTFCSHLDIYKAANNELLSSADSFSEHVAGITEVGSLIETNELNLRLLALNSIIKASSIGKRGKPLAVLSKEINTISRSVQAQISKRGEVIRAMHHSSETIASKLLKNFRTSVAVVDETFDQTEESIQKLLEKDDNVTGCSEVSHQIEADFAELIEQVRFGRIIDDGLDRIIKELLKTNKNLDYNLPDSPNGAELSDLDLQELKIKYTMQAEREIHQATLDSTPLKENSDVRDSGPVEFFDKTEQSSGPESSDDDLGDNIELF